MTTPPPLGDLVDMVTTTHSLCSRSDNVIMLFQQTANSNTLTEVSITCLLHLPNIKSLRQREREMFYLTTHSTHFIYGYMASDIWLRTILIVRKETRCRHIGYSFRLAARVLLYASSHRQYNTYHGLCYTSRGALAGTRNSHWDIQQGQVPSQSPSIHSCTGQRGSAYFSKLPKISLKHGCSWQLSWLLRTATFEVEKCVGRVKKWAYVIVWYCFLVLESYD